MLSFTQGDDLVQALKKANCRDHEVLSKIIKVTKRGLSKRPAPDIVYREDPDETLGKYLAKQSAERRAYDLGFAQRTGQMLANFMVNSYMQRVNPVGVPEYDNMAHLGQTALEPMRKSYRKER